MRGTLVRTVPLLLVALLSAPRLTVAKLHSNTIDDVAPVDGEGKRAYVIARIACDAGERVTVRITVTQETADSVAEGRTSATCTGEVQGVPVKVKARDKTRLEEGSADVCALAVTRQGGEVTDTRQWCKVITLSID